MYVRLEVENTTVHLWQHRRDAIGAANLLTRSTDRQHNAVRADGWWGVENAVTEELRDKDGILPAAVAKKLRADAEYWATHRKSAAKKPRR